MKLDDDDDDPRYEQLICALLHHKGCVEKAAASAGIGRATLYRWLKRPRFASLYRDARRLALGSAMAGLELGASSAVDALAKGFTDANASQVSVTSARWFLTLAIKAHEIETVHAELEAVRADLEEMRRHGGQGHAALAAPVERATMMPLNDDQAEAFALRAAWMVQLGHDADDIAASLRWNRPENAMDEREALLIVQRRLRHDRARAEGMDTA